MFVCCVSVDFIQAGRLAPIVKRDPGLMNVTKFPIGVNVSDWLSCDTLPFTHCMLLFLALVFVRLWVRFFSDTLVRPGLLKEKPLKWDTAIVSQGEKV